MKTRKQHMIEYNENYSNIPKDYQERLDYLKSKYKIVNIQKMQAEIELLKEYRAKTKSISFVLYEIPQTSHRGKARTFSRNNKLLTQIYVPNAKANKNYMTEFIQSTFDSVKLICTEMEIDIIFYLPTPVSLSNSQKIYCEEGLIRPMIKPDVDNVSKAYMDMCTSNLFLDDALVTDLHISKRYSIKPRVEVTIRYYEDLPTSNIYRQITNSKFFKDNIDKFQIPDIVLSNEKIRRKMKWLETKSK